MGLYDIPVIGDIANFLSGDPKDIMAAYSNAATQSRQNGQQTRDFLMQRLAQAQGFYKPVQGMLSQMYGTGGIQPVQQVPTTGAPTTGIIGRMAGR